VEVRSLWCHCGLGAPDDHVDVTVHRFERVIMVVYEFGVVCKTNMAVSHHEMTDSSIDKTNLLAD
jgi:hypothetical protein